MAASTMKLFGVNVLRNVLIQNGSFRFKHSYPKVKYAQTVSNLPRTEISELSNGLRVASFEKDSPTAAVGLWINSGSRDESPEVNGVANFYEHLLLKGNSPKARQDIETQINNIGAQFHANTGREQTSIYAKCLSSDIGKVVEILGNAIGNTEFDNSQIEIERKAILDELQDIQANDLKQVTFDYLHQLGYQGTSLGRSVYGPTKTIENISKSDITEYVKDNVIAPRMVLVGSGNIKHGELVKLAEKHLGSLRKDGNIEPRQTCRFTGSEVRDRDDWLPFAHVAIAVDTCGAKHEDILPLTIAKTHIGRWDKTCLSSGQTLNKLILNIEKEKKCHSFEAFHQIYKDTGLWGCYFVMERMVLDDFMFNLQNEWMKLCVNVSETELAVAKRKLRMDQMEVLNDNALNCNDIGSQILNTGSHVSFRELDERLELICITKLRDACSRYIYDRCPVVSAVGPVENLTDYVRVRSNMYWLRY